MKSKVLIAIAVISLLSVALIYYLGNKGLTKKNISDLTPTGTPLTENSFTSNGVKESSEIKINFSSSTEKLVFHNNSGYEFTSYSEQGITDRVVVSVNGTEILQLGVNWLGNTQGSLPLMKVVKVKNVYIGDLYRATGGGLSDGGYTLASLTKTSGKCLGNGTTVNAPCTEIDQIYGKNKDIVYLSFCTDLEAVTQCDELMSGLEIRK